MHYPNIDNLQHNIKLAEIAYALSLLSKFLRHS